MLTGMRRRYPLAVVFYYPKTNRYGINALAGAVASHEELRSIPLSFPEDLEKLCHVLKYWQNRADQVLVGFSFFTTQLWEVEELLAFIRPVRSKQALFVAGGPHPSADPEGTLKMGFDYVIPGEGEDVFVALLHMLLQGKDPTTVPGVASLDENGRLRYLPNRRPVDLNKMPPFSDWHEKYGPIEITRGCPYACGFCQTSYLFGGKPRHRSVEGILEAVRILKKRGLTTFRAISPNAFSYGSKNGREINLKELTRLLDELARLFKPHGKIFFGTFPSEVRPEHVTEETVRLVREYADNDNLIIGAQSGSPRVLKMAHRGHTVDDVLQAVHIARNSGLKVNVDFIFGLPGETQEDVEQSIALMRKLVGMGARIHAHSFLPLPQTRFAGFSPKPDLEDIGRRIERLFPGALYGNWRRQAQLAQKIASWYARRSLSVETGQTV